MADLLTKLNGTKQTRMMVINAPAEFAGELGRLRESIEVLEGLPDAAPVDFVLTFVRDVAELETWAARILPLLASDALLWWAYPKKSSKRYQSDLYRDSGWSCLDAAGYRHVRQVAIDDDWSAVRSRHKELVGS